MTLPVSPASAPSFARPWLLLTIAGPAVIVTVVILLFICMELAGRTPSAIQAGSIAEAAGLGNAAELMRRLQLGEDPARVQAIRPEIISEAVTRVTTFEAAVFSRRVQLLQLLDERGAIVGADTRHFLACLAQDIESDEIIEYLAPGGPPACASGAARAQVIARSSGIE